MREPVCAVQIFVSIYGRHLTKLFPTTRFLSEMPAEEAKSICRPQKIENIPKGILNTSEKSTYDLRRKIYEA